MSRLAGLALALLVAACTTADLASVAPPPPISQAEKFAAIVIDARNGHVLYSYKANEQRFPASLTKMMTLYLLFQALADGKVTLESRVPISAHAASQPPSKLYIKAGDTISVENAIKAMVTKSANDVAVAVGEFLAGSEDRFARAMTNRARELGMVSTVFRNASGLPDEAQVTTARDMAVLGMALRAHFPARYHYFSLQAFNFRGRTVKGHNHLLGRVPGVDGIKTGYTRASGFNLATSIRRGNRMLIAVIIGEDRGKTRDRHMEELISRTLPKASAAAPANGISARKAKSGVRLYAP